MATNSIPKLKESINQKVSESLKVDISNPKKRFRNSSQSDTDIEYSETTNKSQQEIAGKETAIATSDPVESSEKPKISEENVAIFRTLRKLHIKLQRTKSHAAYLHKCQQQDLIPKTLRAKIIPQIPDSNALFLLKWEEAHLNFSRSLIRLLYEYWNTRINTINTQILDLKSQLKNKENTNEMEHINDLLTAIPNFMKKKEADKESTKAFKDNKKSQ
ncbi:uncharacterized protein LOC134279072 [Saccostrea cucullata]|uniref:uncharacterized protein LOC134279072 n=1 Tax=Saccostrea cuccullata TaxID=36930 RepID=UPI002ED22C8E